MVKKIAGIMLVLLLIAIAVAAVAIFPRARHYYEEEMKANILLEKCRELEIGMTREEVIGIMGEPSRVIQDEFRGRTVQILLFKSPRLAAEATQCFVDKESGLVIQVRCGEEFRVIEKDRSSTKDSSSE